MTDPIPNIFQDTVPTISADRPGLAHGTITDDWGLFFAQGGVVMTSALRAMETVLDRSDLTLASAAGTFCRPVTCGPVTTQVEVLRNGRRGAQVTGILRDQTAPEGEASVSVTAVYTSPDMQGPALAPLPVPSDLQVPPPPDASTEMPDADDFPLGFLDNTEWIRTEAASSEAGSVPRMGVWFRFSDPPAPHGEAWDPALLPIPGDALGSALADAFEGDDPVTSVSLFIGMQVYAPIVGHWIGIDTRCVNVANGLANGVLDLWSETGTHVATVTQTAMIRDLVISRPD